MRKLAVAVVCACASVFALADEWFADASKPAGSGDGTSAATAFHTIQEAVNAAADGDTVTVLPGEYKDGGWTNSLGYVSRVYITEKALTLRSTGGKAVTHIVGAYDPDGCYLDGDPTKTHYDNMGPKAVQCVRAYKAAGTRIEGFTIRDGASHTCPTTDDAYGTGGGIHVVDGSRAVYAVDCLFTGCIASRGGGMRYGTAIRCVFDGNFTRYGTGHAARSTNLYNCLILRSGGSGLGGVVLWGCSLVNCTVAQNLSGSVLQSSQAANSIILVNAGDVGTSDKSNVATNCYVSAIGTAFSDDSKDVKVPTDAYQLIAPALGDCRLKDGATAVTAGTAAAAVPPFIVPAGDLNLDLDKKPVPVSGAVALGCYQEPVVPAGGAWKFQNSMLVDGQTAIASSYFYATNHPMAVNVKMVPFPGRVTFNFLCGGTSRFPQEDESTWLLSSPDTSQVLACNCLYTTNVLYVAKDGDDSDGRSWATAFRTIQQAVDAAPYIQSAGTDSIEVRTIIRVGPGEYTAAADTPVKKSQKNVVYVANRRIRLIGSGNRESVIRGAADGTVVQDAAPWGCGENAIRCLAAENTSISCFQNFTFADGHNVGFSTDAYGGGVNGGGKDYTFICDSVFTNCVGNRGAAIYAGRAVRCRFVDCMDYYCWTRAATTQGCVFEVLNRPPRDAIIGQDAYAYGCTVVGRAAANDSLLRADGNNIYNTVGSHGKNTPSGAACGGNTIWGWSGQPNDNFVKANPAFVDEANGDYRLLSLSEVVGKGTVPADYYKYFEGDIDGNGPLIRNGCLTPGACQQAVAAVVITGPADGTATPSGTVPVEAGETLTVTFTPNKHGILGYVVNGETNLTTRTTYTYVAPADGSFPEPLDLQVLSSPHWYVSPTGDNGNDGWTPDTPKGTLAGVMEKVTAGDIVHAAAGFYTNDYAIASGWTLKSRVVVPEKVTLVADEGPEKTFIVGEEDKTDSKIAAKGNCGPNAMQCVFLSNYSKLNGFTVCGGRTDGGDGDGPDHSGGGVFVLTGGSSDYCGVVENCIISNNWGRSGAATYRGRIVGCQILENHGYASNPAGRYSNLYGCYIDRNYGMPTYQIYYALENCTFGPDNLSASGTRSTGLTVCSGPQGGAVAKNCVFMDRIVKSGSTTVVATNCFFRNDDASYYPDETNRLGCTLKSVADMKMMPGTCVPAADSPLVDTADETLMSGYAKSMDASCVPGGGQRVFNGATDFGAFEHDWRSEYGTMLGANVVSAASPKVVGELGGSSVTIGEGQLDVTLTGGSTTRKNRLTVPFSVVGDGTLSVYWNGGLLGAYTKADGPQTLRFKNLSADNNFVFDYDGDDAGAVVSRLDQMVPGMLLIVR